MVQVVKHLLSMVKTLGSIPSVRERGGMKEK
jgi:hypothetical protein